MKQTAVEWLIDKIVQDQMYKAKSQKEWIDIFEQAKAMEKEQINQACYDGYYSEELFDTRVYYNKTYGK